MIADDPKSHLPLQVPATQAMSYPAWAVLHVPHDSITIPEHLHDQFLLDDHELRQELIYMSDRHTLVLFQVSNRSTCFVNTSVSRLVVDVERFEDDAQEPMSERGMGVIYTQTAHRRPLRRALTRQERQILLDAYYYPHHRCLSTAVDQVRTAHGLCLVLDCHSFPSIALPYELNPTDPRPDICLGTDEFHTPPNLLRCVKAAFEGSGWSVAINQPFSGALVPLDDYQRERTTLSLMIEVRRDLYMDEATGERRPEFNRISDLLCNSLATGLVDFAATALPAASGCERSDH